MKAEVNMKMTDSGKIIVGIDGDTKDVVNLLIETLVAVLIKCLKPNAPVDRVTYAIGKVVCERVKEKKIAKDAAFFMQGKRAMAIKKKIIGVTK